MIKLVEDVDVYDIEELVLYALRHGYNSEDLDAAAARAKFLDRAYSSLNSELFEYDPKRRFEYDLPGGEDRKVCYIDCNNTDISNITVSIFGLKDNLNAVKLEVTTTVAEDNSFEALTYEKYYNYIDELHLACQAANSLASILNIKSTKQDVITNCERFGLTEI